MFSDSVFETRDEMAAATPVAAIRRTISAEHRAAVANANRLRIVSAETRAKMAEMRAAGYEVLRLSERFINGPQQAVLNTLFSRVA
jgi:hypothetical protein